MIGALSVDRPYEPDYPLEQGRRRAVRRHAPDTIVDFAMDRAGFARIRRDDITLVGVDRLRSFLAVP